MGINIEWESYDEHGRRRVKPPASTVHGWLVKWRGTFSGDEEVRRRGIKEMREAKAIRAYRKQKKGGAQSRKGSGGGISFLGSGKPKKKGLAWYIGTRKKSHSPHVARPDPRRNKSHSRQVGPRPTNERHNTSRSGKEKAGHSRRSSGHRSQQSPRPSAKKTHTTKRSGR